MGGPAPGPRSLPLCTLRSQAAGFRVGVCTTVYTGPVARAERGVPAPYGDLCPFNRSSQVQDVPGRRAQLQCQAWASPAQGTPRVLGWGWGGHLGLGCRHWLPCGPQSPQAEQVVGVPDVTVTRWAAGSFPNARQARQHPAPTHRVFNSHTSYGSCSAPSHHHAQKVSAPSLPAAQASSLWAQHLLQAALPSCSTISPFPTC